LGNPAWPGVISGKEAENCDNDDANGGGNDGDNDGDNDGGNDGGDDANGGGNDGDNDGGNDGGDDANGGGDGSTSGGGGSSCSITSSSSSWKVWSTYTRCWVNSTHLTGCALHNAEDLLQVSKAQQYLFVSFFVYAVNYAGTFWAHVKLSILACISVGAGQLVP